MFLVTYIVYFLTEWNSVHCHLEEHVGFSVVLIKAKLLHN